MKKYTRDNFLFQIERDKGAKIKTQLLDMELSKLASYIDFVLQYVKTIEVGTFVGKYGFENCLFKNVGNAVILEKTSGIALKYTFLDYLNCFFVYNANLSNEVYNLIKPNSEGMVLKYKNNNFEFGKIVDEIKINSVNATEKIVNNVLSFKKIKQDNTIFPLYEPHSFKVLFFSKMLFKKNAITKFKIKSYYSLQNIISNIKPVLDPLSEITPTKIANCYVPSLIGNSVIYYRDNGFNIQQRWAQYFTNPAVTLTQKEEYQRIAGRAFSLSESPIIPIDVVKAKSVTSLAFIKNKNPADIEPNDSGLFAYRDSFYRGQSYLLPITLLEFYLSNLFFGAKEIKNRHLDKINNSLYFAGNEEWFLSRGVATKSKILLNDRPNGYSTYYNDNNFHIARECLEARHFCDNSISITALVQKYSKIPINKFSRVFLNRLGL